jgi:uncharacterized membrane protein
MTVIHRLIYLLLLAFGFAITSAVLTATHKCAERRIGIQTAVFWSGLCILVIGLFTRNQLMLGSLATGVLLPLALSTLNREVRQRAQREPH